MTYEELQALYETIGCCGDGETRPCGVCGEVVKFCRWDDGRACKAPPQPRHPETRVECGR